MGDPEWSFPEPEAKWEPNRGENAKPARAAIRTAAWQGKKGSVLPPPARRAPRAPARAQVAGGSAASRTSGCCLAAAAAAARLRSPGRRRRRRPRSRPGSRSQEQRHRHGRHQRWAWGAGRRRAGWPPERGGGVPGSPRTPPPRPGLPPPRSLSWRLPPAPRPPPPPSQPESPAGRGAPGWARGAGGFSVSPCFLLISAASLPPIGPRRKNEVVAGLRESRSASGQHTCSAGVCIRETGEQRVILRGLRALEMPVTEISVISLLEALVRSSGAEPNRVPPERPGGT